MHPSGLKPDPDLTLPHRDFGGIRSEALTSHNDWGFVFFLVFNHTFMFAVYVLVILNTTCTNGRICAGTQKILGKFQHENAQFSEKTNFKIYERTNKDDWLTSIYSNFGHTKEMQSPEGLYDYAIYNGELVHFSIRYKLVAQNSQYVFIEKVGG